MRYYKVAVTGSRVWPPDDKALIFSSLQPYLDAIPEEDELLLIQGGAEGVDLWAREWALREKIQIVTFPYRNIGKKGGPIRNRTMLEVMRPDVLLVFPGGKGTRSCANIARELGIPVEEISYE